MNILGCVLRDDRAASIGSCDVLSKPLLGEVGRAAALDNVVDMIAHRHEQIEEELGVALLHLHLHCAAALEGLAAADDECEVVCAEARVAGRRVRVGETCTAQYGRYVDAGLQALFPESKALQIGQREAQRGAVDGCVTEDIITHAVVVDCRGVVEAVEFLGFVRVVRARCGRGSCLVVCVLERPRVTLLVVHEARVVVALVQEFEDGAEDLWLLVWESDASLAWGLEELLTAGRGEPRRAREDIFMRGEETLVLAHSNRDDGAVELG